MVILIHYGGEKEMFKNKPEQTQSQQVYIPAYINVLPEATLSIVRDRTQSALIESGLCDYQAM